MRINKNAIRMIEVVVTVAVGLVAIRGSTPSVVPSVDINTNKNKLPTISNAQLIRKDTSQHVNECSSDNDCNPNIANPLKFTNRCDMSSYSIEEGGNQGGVCEAK